VITTAKIQRNAATVAPKLACSRGSTGDHYVALVTS